MEAGWVSIHRQIKDNWIWQDKPFSKGQAWIDLLLMANHTDRKFALGNEVVTVKRGALITSEKKLMENWGWSKGKVRSFLKTLEDDGMINKKTDRKKTTINIVNYSFFQDSETTERPQTDHKQTANRPQTDHKQTANRPQTDTNNNYNNDNNENNVNNVNNGNCKNVKPIPDNKQITDTDDVTDNNNGDKSPNIKSVSDNIKDVIDYLNLVCGTNYKSTTKATIEVIKARLKEGFTVDDFKSVIDKKHYEWGIDPKMSCYLRPQTLFGTKFESYLNQPYTDGRTLSESDKAMLRWAQTPREEKLKDIDKLLLEGDMF